MKTHWRQLVNPDYLGSYSLPDGKDITVRITKVVREMVTSVGGKQEECTVAHIENNKPLILNVTNSRMIQKLYGTPYIEDWAGKEITLYAATTKLKGEDVECLRIRPKQPSKPILQYNTKEYEKVLSAMMEGYTLEQIRTKWQISKELEAKINEEL